VAVSRVRSSVVDLGEHQLVESGHPARWDRVRRAAHQSHSSTVCTTTGISQFGNTSVADLCQDSGLSPALPTATQSPAGLGNWLSTPGTVSFTTMAVTISSPNNGTAFAPNWGVRSAVRHRQQPAPLSRTQGVDSNRVQAVAGPARESWTTACPTTSHLRFRGQLDAESPIGDLNSVNTYH